MKTLRLTIFLLCLFAAAQARADCVNPPGVESEMLYNADYKTVQFCDGANWWSMKGGSPSLLRQLVDVDDALAPDDGEILVYDSAGGKWVTGSAGLASETDPQVGATTNNQWCRGDGSAVQCDQAAPVIPPGMLCGLATRGPNTSACSSGTYTSMATCEGASIASACPSGYTQRTVTIDDGNTNMTCIRTCSKN